MTHQYVYHGRFISAVIAVEHHNSSSDGKDHVSSLCGGSSPLGRPGVGDRGQVRVAVVEGDGIFSQHCLGGTMATMVAVATTQARMVGGEQVAVATSPRRQQGVVEGWEVREKLQRLAWT